MKAIFFSPLFFLFCICQNIKAQSDSIDTEYLKSQYLKGVINFAQYQKLTKIWNEDVFYIEGYPELPYKSDIQDIKYVYYFSFDSLDKNIIYNRILEWMSLKYSSLASVIDYQDYELGKIIIKTRNPMKAYRSDRLFYVNTLKFTLIENKLKFEISQLSFDYEYNKYAFGETTFYNYLINDPIRNYFPITKNNYGYWKEYLQIIKSAKTDIEENANKIEEFIRETYEEYNF